MSMNLEKKIAAVKSRLEQAELVYGHGTSDADDEALCIVLHILGIDRTSVSNDPFSSEHNSLAQYDSQDWQANRFDARIDELVEKRIQQRMPLAYLAKETWFADNKFYIDQRAIIPRSYLGEWIADAFMPWVKPSKTHSILDLCTGCGCIAISCALAFPYATVLASDISNPALAVAGINIDNYQLGERIRLHHADGFTGIEQRFDLIVCNPPYVSDERMACLPAEYCHEPDNAFRGGQNGLDFIAPMLSHAEHYLTDEGILIVEAGSASHTLEQHYPTIPFTWLSTAYDEMVIFTLSASELREHATTLRQAVHCQQSTGKKR